MAHPVSLSSNREILNNNAMLLRTGKFSDLTLVCQGHEYRVHRAIICPRSPVWAAAIEKDFQEAKTGRIVVNETANETLQHALAYLYIGYYDDFRAPHFEYSTGLAVAEAAASIASMSCDEPEPTPIVHDANADVADEEASTVQDSSKCTCSINSLKLVCVNDRLRANALLYILADYYQIPGLEAGAEETFAKTAKDLFCLDDLGALCLLVYDSVPPTALGIRKSLTLTLSNHAQQLVQNQTFMDTVSELPELCRDLLLEIVQQNHVMAEAKAAAVAASGKSSTAARSAKDAAARAQEELANMRRLATRPKMCRDCGSRNIS